MSSVFNSVSRVLVPINRRAPKRGADGEQRRTAGQAATAALNQLAEDLKRSSSMRDTALKDSQTIGRSNIQMLQELKQKNLDRNISNEEAKENLEAMKTADVQIAEELDKCSKRVNEDIDKRIDNGKRVVGVASAAADAAQKREHADVDHSYKLAKDAFEVACAERRKLLVEKRLDDDAKATRDKAHRELELKATAQKALTDLAETQEDHKHDINRRLVKIQDEDSKRKTKAFVKVAKTNARAQKSMSRHRNYAAAVAQIGTAAVTATAAALLPPAAPAIAFGSAIARSRQGPQVEELNEGLDTGLSERLEN